MSKKINVTERFYGRPLMVDDSYAQHLNQRYGEQLIFEVDEEGAFSFHDAGMMSLPSDDGFAHIPVSGTLLHGVDFAVTGFLTGYDYISSAIKTANANSTIGGIVLHVDSHGGEVSGCFECADVIASSEKPVIAVVRSYAHSAAYALASAADMVSMPETGSVGSIGVVTMHVDYSEALAKDGIKPTLIYSGKHKVDGNPYEPLSDAVHAKIQARLDQLRDVFVATVAEGRGIENQVVHDTEAQVYGADEAVALGLVDAVMSPDEALAAFRTEVFASGIPNIGGFAMTKTKDGAEGTVADAPLAESLDINQIKAEAASEERVRIRDILASEEAEGREKQASFLAFETSMAVDDAVRMLAASAKEVAEVEQGNAFEAAMNSSEHPEVGDDGGTVQADEEASPVVSMFAVYDRVHGRKTH